MAGHGNGRWIDERRGARNGQRRRFAHRGRGRKHAHPKGTRQVSYATADVAVADQPESEAIQLALGRPIMCPLVAALRPDVGRKVAAARLAAAMRPNCSGDAARSSQHTPTRSGLLSSTIPSPPPSGNGGLGPATAVAWQTTGTAVPGRWPRRPVPTGRTTPGGARAPD